MKKFLLLTPLILAGCVSYQSKFVVAGNTMVLPKDATFSYMQVSIPTTNGPLTLVISNATFKMNPAVIDSKTAHDVAVINAVGSQVQSAISAAPK